MAESCRNQCRNGRMLLESTLEWLEAVRINDRRAGSRRSLQRNGWKLSKLPKSTQEGSEVAEVNVGSRSRRKNGRKNGWKSLESLLDTAIVVGLWKKKGSSRGSTQWRRKAE